MCANQYFHDSPTYVAMIPPRIVTIVRDPAIYVMV